MTDDAAPAPLALLPRVQAVLEAALGGPVRLEPGRTLTDPDRRNALRRYRLLGRLATPPPPSWSSARTARSTARTTRTVGRRAGSSAAGRGLRFLTSVGDGGAPRFYGGDRDSGFVVMEDLGEPENLAHVLCCGTRAAAENALTGFAAALGAMHAETIGLADRYPRVAGPG